MTEHLEYTLEIGGEDIRDRHFMDGMVIARDGSGRRIDNSRFWCGEAIGREVNSLGCIDLTSEDGPLLTHNSFLWSIDELVDLSVSSGHGRMRDNLLAEALSDSLHQKGKHSMAMNLSVAIGAHATLERNMFAACATRIPRLAGGGSKHFLNNVVSTWGAPVGRDSTFNSRCGYSTSEPMFLNLIENYYIVGLDHEGIGNDPEIIFHAGDKTHWFADGNIVELPDGRTVEGRVVGGIQHSEPLAMPGVSSTGILDARAAYKHVLNHAGPKPRHHEEQRIVDAVENRSIRIRDHA